MSNRIVNQTGPESQSRTVSVSTQTMTIDEFLSADSSHYKRSATVLKVNGRNVVWVYRHKVTGETGAILATGKGTIPLSGTDLITVIQKSRKTVAVQS